MANSEPNAFILLSLTLAFIWCCGWGVYGIFTTFDAHSRWGLERRKQKNPLPALWCEVVHLMRHDREGWSMPIQGMALLFHARTGCKLDFSRFNLTLEVPGGCPIAAPPLFHAELIQACKALRDVISIQQLVQPKEEIYTLVTK